ncbi:MAG: shikimate kinase [Ancalomicrobiaceae bacterium]|nr:shikimate kinase [Ancalomicrobiaceae bacterium]
MQTDKARLEHDRLARISAELGPRSIVLVGMMGAGKTTIGKRLAARLGIRFVDADGEIERAAAQTIPEIFAEHGEAYFRDGERRVISRLLGEGPQVLATGGGAFMNADTRAAISDLGISVWLEADAELLLARVRRRSNRPLLDTPDPEGTLRRLIAERYPIYALADVTVQSRDVAHDIMCDDMIAALIAHFDRQKETKP